jgi:hypothetical protein
LDEIRAPTAAYDAETMGIVGHEPRVMALCQRGEAVQRRDIPVHGEDAVGRDEGAVMSSPQLRQQHPHMPHVGVAERNNCRAREPRSGP